jgi:hypothetical protein
MSPPAGFANAFSKGGHELRALTRRKVLEPAGAETMANRDHGGGVSITLPSGTAKC